MKSFEMLQSCSASLVENWQGMVAEERARAV